MSELESAIKQIRTARLYTQAFLREFDEGDWFRQPGEGVTHLAWQVGHLAVAQYSLALKRLRGERESDKTLIPPDFRKAFGIGSTPDPDPARNPLIEEIRAVFENVHSRVRHELSSLTESQAAEPVQGNAHPMFKTKLESLQWCGQHEFVHAGQIGLLRRLFGNDPLR